MRIRLIIYPFFFLFALVLIFILLPLSDNELTQKKTCSVQILDRNGKLLREVLSSESSSSILVQISEVTLPLIQATLAAEDKNFYSHVGIDFTATLRALGQNLKALKIVSGASTISQQTSRLILGLDRGLFQKAYTVLYALRLEAHRSKNDILIEYLNRAPYGNQCYGIGAASKFYFNKSPVQLTLAESALLAGLPQSPSLYEPLRHFESALKRQHEVLRRMLANEFITDTEYRDALLQPIDFTNVKRAFHAPHFVEYILKLRQSGYNKTISDQLNGAHTLITSLDSQLQEECETLAKIHIQRLQKNRVKNIALVVMENKTGNILTMLGSVDYFKSDSIGLIDGQFNVATAARQPGSSLKPFTYALGLSKGLTAASLLPDLPIPFQIQGRFDESSATGVEMFIPQNFDKKFHGPVRFREALACSFNITAVKVLQLVGVENLYQLLKRLDFSTLSKDSKYYGLGLTLGNSDVRLIEMVRAYSLFARKGKFIHEEPIKAIVNSEFDTILIQKEMPMNNQIFSPQLSYLMLDILSDNGARRASFGSNSVLKFPFAVACKTGTTKDYRDNWTFGVSEDFTVGVWAGNSDNTPMQGVSGVDGAGSLMHDVMMLLSKKYPNCNGFNKTQFDMPHGIRVLKICPISGELENDWCGAAIEEKFIEGKQPNRYCTIHKPYQVDKRNNLLATSSTPSKYVHEQVFADYPALYREWAENTRKPLPPIHFSTIDRDSLSGNSLLESNQDLEIQFPQSGMIFALDGVLKSEYQRLLFSALIPPNTEKIEWKLNGKIIGETNGNEKFAWQLAEGAYVLQAISNGKTSPIITFSVIR